MTRKTVWLVLVLGLVLGIAGIVNAQGDVVELWYMGWAWPGDQPQEPRLEAFMQQYQNIIVTYEYVDAGQFNDRITALAAAGTLPDVLWVMDNNMYVYNQWVADIT